MLSSYANQDVSGILELVSLTQGADKKRRYIYTNHEILIGRDISRCNWAFEDPYLSRMHLRIYTVVYDTEHDHGVRPLVFAEILSKHGIFWNDTFLGRSDNAVLLSDGDWLRLSNDVQIKYLLSGEGKSTGADLDPDLDCGRQVEMKVFEDKYVVTNRLLGVGAFGHVFMALERTSHVQIACKVVDLRKLAATKQSIATGNRMCKEMKQLSTAAMMNTTNARSQRQNEASALEARLRTYYREVEILSSIVHPNIIALNKAYVTDNMLFVFQELVTGGDLFSYLEMRHGRLQEAETAAVVYQILTALKFLHGQQILHRDLKPDNIMMTSFSIGARVVLTDFGAACRVEGPDIRSYSPVGTDEYAAPEVTGHNTWHQSCGITGYTAAVDMWSLGAVTVVLMIGASAFTDLGTGEFSRLSAAACNLGFLNKSKDWAQVRTRPRDFVSRLLILDETRRMTAEEGLEHEWFSNLAHKADFEALYQRSIKSWKPKPAKQPVIEFAHSSSIQFLPSSQQILNRLGTDSQCKGKALELQSREAMKL